MRVFIILTLLTTLLCPLKGQLLTVTAYGTVTSVETDYAFPIDPSVQIGDSYTATFSFNAEGSGSYDWGYGTCTVSFTGYNGVSDANLGTQACYLNIITNGSGFFGQSGYIFGSTLFAPDNEFAQAGLTLETTDPTVASLITSNNVVQIPVSDFNYSTGQELDFLQGYEDVDADVTSYTVSVSEAPEPSSFSLIAFSLALITSVGWHRHRSS